MGYGEWQERLAASPSVAAGSGVQLRATAEAATRIINGQALKIVARLAARVQSTPTGPVDH
jgi:hypothetical protein